MSDAAGAKRDCGRRGAIGRPDQLVFDGVARQGRHPEEYEDGEFVEAPSWLAGSEDAKAGIMMQSEPAPATPSYSEGWGPKVGWTDRGRVFETGSETCVPFGCYKGVLVIDEFNRDEPDAHQL